MLHIIKLSVGPKDVAALRGLQAARLKREGELFHRTRVMPKRAEEVCAGGSIYWVVAGLLRVRQRIVAIREDAEEDGTACCALVFDPTLVLVEPRPQKPFQGWRYLKPEEAPPDVAMERVPARGLEALPPRLRRELAELCLI